MGKKSGIYWIFAFDGYYPTGGMNDFKFSFNTVEEFEDKILGLSRYDNYQFLNTETHHHFQSDLGTITKWICKNIGDERYEDNL